ncbi:unnamed protein product [Closterium sp. NIES-64]|nr:unnamed protein product [Closterium sp. NIES-64]
MNLLPRTHCAICAVPRHRESLGAAEQSAAPPGGSHGSRAPLGAHARATTCPHQPHRRHILRRLKPCSLQSLLFPSYPVLLSRSIPRQPMLLSSRSPHPPPLSVTPSSRPSVGGMAGQQYLAAPSSPATSAHLPLPRLSNLSQQRLALHPLHTFLSRASVKLLKTFVASHELHPLPSSATVSSRCMRCAADACDCHQCGAVRVCLTMAWQQEKVVGLGGVLVQRALPPSKRARATRAAAADAYCSSHSVLLVRSPCSFSLSTVIANAAAASDAAVDELPPPTNHPPPPPSPSLFLPSSPSFPFSPSSPSSPSFPSSPSSPFLPSPQMLNLCTTTCTCLHAGAQKQERDAQQLSSTLEAYYWQWGQDWRQQG